MKVADWDLVRGRKRRKDAAKVKNVATRRSRAEQLKETRNEKIICPIVAYLFDRWPR